MTLSNGPQAWTLEMGYGSLQQYLFTFTYPSNGRPVPHQRAHLGIRGPGHAAPAAAARSSRSRPTPNSQGALTVTTAASTVLLTLYPAATSGLATGQYAHSLWSNPGWRHRVLLVQRAA